MSDYRRICFYGGPGCGKSTLAAKVFSALKQEHYDVELVSEYIKTWAHQKRKPTSWDQLYVFGKQVHSEDIILQNVKYIVTDSPILLNTAYSTFYNFPSAQHLTNLAIDFERDFPSINFFVKRTVPYVEAGRYQDYSKAVEFDNWLQEYLSLSVPKEIKFMDVDINDDTIIETIKTKIRDG